MGESRPSDIVTCTNTKALWGRAETASWVRDLVLPHADLLTALGFFACVPSPLLLETAAALDGTGVEVGAQDGWPDGGLHTGQVPMALLAELGCRNVMVGHAEHRRDTGESDELVARKVAAASSAGVRPLLCVGEREHVSTDDARRTVSAQVATALADVPAGGEVLVLYEPAWAIGAPEGAPPGHVAAVLRSLRETSAGRGLDVRLLYGGGVTSGTWTALHDHGAPLDGLGLGRVVRQAGLLREVAAELLGTSTLAVG